MELKRPTLCRQGLLVLLDALTAPKRLFAAAPRRDHPEASLHRAAASPAALLQLRDDRALHMLMACMLSKIRAVQLRAQNVNFGKVSFPCGLGLWLSRTWLWKWSLTC